MSHPSAVTEWIRRLPGTLDQNLRYQATEATLEPEQNCIIPLTHYGFLLTEGPDTNRFLQGQATCDFAKAVPGQNLPGGLCTAKGRLYCNFRSAVESPQRVLMRMQRDLLSSTRDRLGKYIVFSKAEQSDCSEDYLAIGLRGDTAATNIQAVFGQLPSGLNQQCSNDNGWVIQVDEAGTWFECWLKITQLEGLWPQLSEGLILQGTASWELAMIRLGQAEVCAATVDEFIPQMLNLHHSGAISFTKGCYTGQEVVARMQYKGTMKRQLYRIRIENPGLMAGSPLFRTDSEQSIGNIVNTVPLDDQRSEALAVISIKDVEAGSTIADENGHSLEVLSLPYAITN